MHFLDDEGKSRTFLLGLPRIEGRHSSGGLRWGVHRSISTLAWLQEKGADPTITGLDSGRDAEGMAA